LMVSRHQAALVLGCIFAADAMYLLNLVRGSSITPKSSSLDVSHPSVQSYYPRTWSSASLTRPSTSCILGLSLGRWTSLNDLKPLVRSLTCT